MDGYANSRVFGKIRQGTWQHMDGMRRLGNLANPGIKVHPHPHPISPAFALMQVVQELYEQCQASFDPNNIAALLHSHPYHLDALLTMHDLYRSMGENAYAGEHWFIIKFNSF